MKKLLVVSAIAALGFSSVAFAGGLPEEMPAAPAATITSDTGIYLGLSGGYGMTNWKNMDGMLVSDSKNVTRKVGYSGDNGFVGRVFLGYDVTRYVALELGYSYFFNKPKWYDTNLNPNKDMGKVKYTHDIDFMGKIKAPVVDNFDIYGKIGVNYLMSKGDTEQGNDNNFNVAYGAGADYYITPNIIANVEWLRFNGKAKIADVNYQPATDAFLIGLRYKFDL